MVEYSLGVACRSLARLQSYGCSSYGETGNVVFTPGSITLAKLQKFLFPKEKRERKGIGRLCLLQSGHRDASAPVCLLGHRVLSQRRLLQMSGEQCVAIGCRPCCKSRVKTIARMSPRPPAGGQSPCQPHPSLALGASPPGPRRLRAFSTGRCGCRQGPSCAGPGAGVLTCHSPPWTGRLEGCQSGPESSSKSQPQVSGRQGRGREGCPSPLEEPCAGPRS